MVPGPFLFRDWFDQIVAHTQGNRRCEVGAPFPCCSQVFPVSLGSAVRVSSEVAVVVVVVVVDLDSVVGCVDCLAESGVDQNNGCCSVVGGMGNRLAVVAQIVAVVGVGVVVAAAAVEIH